MASTFLLLVLKVLMFLICAAWVSLWILKPTQLWTKKWKVAEGSAVYTVFGYNGLDFAVYTFPVIALAMIGFVYLELKPREPRSRQGRRSTTFLSKPVIVNSCIGILSGIEILAVSLFVVFLLWTAYARLSNDFKKMTPVKYMKLSLWQYKFMKVAIRLGSSAEACLALLLLPILRGMSIFRIIGIQFEASVRYHVWLGTAMILFATLHGVGSLFIWGIKHKIQDEIWKWQKEGRIYLAGEMALVTGLVIWITSLPQIRRRKFEIFYYTHHLYIVFLVFFLFHVGDRHFYMVFPGVFLFGLDKLLRIIQSRPETCILSARVFPSKVIELTLPKDQRLKYSPTSVIFMKIPSISKFQWHCFSIASGSRVNDQTMSVLVKCEGGWTNALYDIIQSELDSGSSQTSCIPVAIEGPYGPASVDFLRYDSVLMIAGGIGITPFLSILSEISSGRKRIPTKIQLIYVVKSSKEICMLQPILPLILNQTTAKFHLEIKVYVTQEVRSGATVRGLLNEFSQVETISFDTKYSNYATHGLESLLMMGAITGFSSIMFLVFLSCFNHAFVSLGKKASKEQIPSSETDLFLGCCFAMAIMCGASVALILRWAKLRKTIPPLYQKQDKEVNPLSMETSGALDKHEIHFGGRPNLKDIFAEFPNETGRSDIGVLVCGPETMQETVALLCRLSPQDFKLCAQKKKPCFSFHSLTFSL